MAVLDISSTTHASNALLVNVPDDGKTYDALFTVSRYSDNGNALTYVGVNIAFAGASPTSNPDIAVSAYASMSGSQQLNFVVQNIKKGDVRVSTASKGWVAGVGFNVNTLISCVLCERVATSASGGVQDVFVRGCA